MYISYMFGSKKIKKIKFILRKLFELHELKKYARNELLDNVWFSDETHFLLSCHVNIKNIIF